MTLAAVALIRIYKIQIIVSVIYSFVQHFFYIKSPKMFVIYCYYKA